MSYSYTVSVETSDSEKVTTKKQETFTLKGDLSIKFGKFGGISASMSKSWMEELNTEIQTTLKATESQTRTKTCSIEGEKNVALYQWVITKGTRGKSSFYKAATPFTLCEKMDVIPLCPPWLCNNDDCTKCRK